MKLLLGIIIGATLFLGANVYAQTVHYSIYPVARTEDGVIDKYYDEDSDVVCYVAFKPYGNGSSRAIDCLKNN